MYRKTASVGFNTMSNQTVAQRLSTTQSELIPFSAIAIILLAAAQAGNPAMIITLHTSAKLEKNK